MGELLISENEDKSGFNEDHATTVVSIPVDEDKKPAPEKTPYTNSATKLDIDTQRDKKEEAEQTKPSNGPDKDCQKPPLPRLKSSADIKPDTSGLTTQYIATGIVNLSTFAVGMCLSWTSPALSQMLNETYMLTDEARSWVASLLCLGACCGSIPAGLLSEHFGRKKTLLYLALPLLVSWLLLASSPSCSGIYVGRAVAGVAAGAVSVAVPPYVADIADAGSAPTLHYFYHVQFAAGILFGYILGIVRNVTVLSMLSACLPVIYFVAFIFLPESPVYLLSQGKLGEAKNALVYFRGIDNDTDQEIIVMKENIKNSFKNKATFRDVFTSKSNAKALLVCFALMVFQQLSGIYAVIMYAEHLLALCNISMSPPCGAIVIGFCLVSATYFSTILLGKYPRRSLLMLSFGTMAPALLSLGTFFHLYAYSIDDASVSWIPVFLFCVFVTAYAIGAGPIPWLMLREIFPSNVTRRATAITAGFHWFVAFLVTKMFESTVNMIGAGWVLCNFGVSSLVATMFVYCLVPETHNRSLEVIQNEFNGIPAKKVHTHIIQVESFPS